MGTRTAFVHCAFLHAWNSAWPWEELRKHTSNEWLSRNSPLMDGILQADFFFFFFFGQGSPSEGVCRAQPRIMTSRQSVPLLFPHHLFPEQVTPAQPPTEAHTHPRREASRSATSCCFCHSKRGTFAPLLGFSITGGVGRGVGRRQNCSMLPGHRGPFC